MERPPIVDAHVFAGPQLPAELRWHSEPSRWSFVDGRLRIEPDAPTDFWQRTHYGFRADNGHFLFCETQGDFVLTTRVLFQPVSQYDQAGIMVRISPDCWLKASVEFEPTGPSRLGAVVTNSGYSDWSAQDFPSGPGQVWLRVRREADDYIVDASTDRGSWSLLRMAHLHEGCGAPVMCGVYACCPKASGFVCEFAELLVVPGRLMESRSP